MRQDLIGDDAGVERWAGTLVRVLRDVLADEGVYQPRA
jgi:predicted N-formylglutamate amidohydrolase